MRGNKLFKILDFFAGIPLLLVLSLFRKRKMDPALLDISPKRILAIKFVALGDAVLLVPSLRVLKKKFPKAEIVFLGTGLTETFLQQFPEYIGHFIAIKVSNLLRNPLYFLRVVRELRAENFDAVVDFEQWPRLSALLASLCGAGIRLGFRTKGQHRHFAFTNVVTRDALVHEVDNFLTLAGLLTGEQGTRDLEIKVDEAASIRMQGFLSRNGWQKTDSVVIVHPGCGTHGFPREWQPKNYAALLNKLGETRRIFAVVTGTQSEKSVMDGVARELRKAPVKFVIENFEDLVALLSMSSLLVSANNGAMHVGAALKSPQIALHGPTNPKQWGPVNPNAIVIQSRCPGCPCLDLGFEYHRRDGYCMEQIDAEEVYRAAVKILSGSTS
ncbi:MAG TPA: glycosyltransferase family 9 protein [Bacteroidota bacterium]|nr:glycosyltransferase family 9 protein [Bacteroidota bacterium]